MLPYLDTPSFVRRTVMPSGDVGVVELAQPGFTATRIMVAQSYINSRLRKRYGKVLPLGQAPPVLVSVGTLPPAIALMGRPVLGSVQVVIAITTGGPVGTAIFKYSLDGGITWLLGLPTASSVPLGASGMSALFPIGTYSTDNVYYASTPVPESVLGWLTAIVTVDLYRKRGVNPQDPTIEMVREDAKRALDELKEAADSEMGLFDLPIADDGASAINTGGPLGHSEQSPYVWADKERHEGRREDARHVEITDDELLPPGGGVV